MQVRKEATGNTTRITQKEIVEVSWRMIDCHPGVRPSFRLAEIYLDGFEPQC